MSKAEASFTYENKVWECALLPYRIIVCKDGIQYIVQLREQIKCRDMIYHMNWSGIAKRYPQLALAGLPEHSPRMLEDEVRGRVMKFNQKPAHREVCGFRLPILRRYPEPSAEQVLGSLSPIPTLCHAGMRGKNLPTI